MFIKCIKNTFASTIEIMTHVKSDMRLLLAFRVVKIEKIMEYAKDANSFLMGNTAPTYMPN